MHRSAACAWRSTRAWPLTPDVTPAQPTNRPSTGTPIYVLASKDLIAEYPSLWVTAWSYFFAALMLMVITLIINNTQSLLDLMCPPPDQACGEGWDIPAGAFWPLMYWIFFSSALAYALITWGNQHLEASRLSAYFALQPIMAVIASTFVVMTTAAPHYGLSGPGPQHLGAIGVFAGLYLVIKGSSPLPDGYRLRKP